jgi:multidrug transporter EmrE-like cation transporter
MPEEEHFEKWHEDPLGGVFFGLILIIGASIYIFKERLPVEPWWALIIVAIGCIFILEALVRSVRTEYRRPSLGKAVWGIIFIAIGMGFFYGFEEVWPVIIIVAGVIILLYFMRQSV